MNNLIYDIKDKPKKWYEWILYTAQMLAAVFVATVLIANICGTNVAACLVGAGIGTLIYQLITKFRSPIFISSCGATCSAVIGALAIGNGNNYLAVALGGLIIALVYAIFAFIVKKFGSDKLTKIFPATIVGAITVVIGINLAGFIPTYVHNQTPELLLAIATMFVVALSSHYFKGFWKTIPFLIGLVFGYIVATIFTVSGIYQFIDFSKFSSIQWLPDFGFMHFADNIKTFEWSQVGEVALLFTPVAICALLEHYSDHKVLSGIIGHDLTEDPGLHRTLLGDGVASFMGTVVAGLPNTSYGESTATIGFSKVASVWISTTAAVVLIALGFIGPVQTLLDTIPSCVFGGCSMILYGYIASSGLKTIKNNVNLDNNKELIVVSVILTVGVSGVFLFTNAFAGVSLAMVLGLILNLILRDKKTN